MNDRPTSAECRKLAERYKGRAEAAANPAMRGLLIQAAGHYLALAETLAKVEELARSAA